MKRLITINSVNRTSGTSSNFEYQILKSKRVNYVNLVSCQIPNTYYNIRSIYNNQFKLNEGGADILIEITPGNYDIDSLVTELTNIILASSATLTYSITYNSNQGQLSFTGSAAFDLKFFTCTYPANEVLGFDLDDYSADGSYQIDAPYIIDLRLVNNYYIYLDLFSNGQLGYDQNQRYTFVVPNTGNKFEYSVYNSNLFDQSFKINDSLLNLIKVEIRDDNYRILDLNGVEWSMIFEINEIF